MTANGDVDLTLTADEATTNGLLEITWDPSLMDYVSGVSTAQLSSFQPAEGKLLFGYAAEKEIASDAVLANLTFRPKDDVHCDLEVQVKTLQRNAESGLDLSETIVVKSDGVEHNWANGLLRSSRPASRRARRPASAPTAVQSRPARSPQAPRTARPRPSPTWTTRSGIMRAWITC